LKARARLAPIRRQWCDTPPISAAKVRPTIFKANGIVGLHVLDTRALTRIIREHGVMNAAIRDALPQDLTVSAAAGRRAPVPRRLVRLPAKPLCHQSPPAQACGIVGLWF
jgi:carbamoylphosphate synthase small subunit